MTELRLEVPDVIAERLAAEASQRGTTPENLATELLSRHVPAPARSGRLGFIGIASAKPGALSVAEAERRLEDHLDEGFGR